MTGQLDLTALLFLAIAVIVFLRLRSVLGRRTGDDEARIDRYRNQRAAEQQKQQSTPPADGKVVTLPRREREVATAEAAPKEAAADRDLRMTKFAGGNGPLARGLIEVAKADAGFDPVEFMKGARAAYEMIVMAFSEGNRKLLGDLLSPEVFSGFDEVLRSREAQRQTIEQSFVGINAAEMIESEMAGKNAQVTVKFVSELISAVRDQAGEVVSGDPKKIKEVTDVWTFARDTSTRDPNWRLVATQAAH